MGRKSREKRERRAARQYQNETYQLNPSLEAADRVDELKKELHRMAGGDAEFWSSGQCPPEFEQSYLEDILAFESVESGVSLFEGLKQKGMDLPDPEKLDEEESRSKVVEILNALAKQNVFIIGEDGMTARQFYSVLWKETLWEGCYIKRRNSASMTVMDVSRGLKAKMRKALRSLQERTVVH